MKKKELLDPNVCFRDLEVMMLEGVPMEAKDPTHHHHFITNLSYTKILPEMPSRARTQCINKPVIESHSIIMNGEKF